MLEKLKSFAGVFQFQLNIHEDERGIFVKTYHSEIFKELGINTEWQEQYLSTSVQGVLRGLHVQLPPNDHEKMVVCTAGKVFDVVVDLRKGQPTFGQHKVFELSPWQGVYIPRGFAHGFCVSAEKFGTLLYSTSTVHCPEKDSGIMWDSAGIDWPLKDPLLSPRDKKFVSFKDFQSPFV